MVNPSYTGYGGYGGYPRYGGYPGYGGFGGYPGYGGFGGYGGYGYGGYPFHPFAGHPCSWHSGYYPFAGLPPLRGYPPDSVNAIHSAVHVMSPTSPFNFTTSAPLQKNHFSSEIKVNIMRDVDKS